MLETQVIPMVMITHPAQHSVHKIYIYEEEALLAEAVSLNLLFIGCCTAWCQIFSESRMVPRYDEPGSRAEEGGCWQSSEQIGTRHPWVKVLWVGPQLHLLP